MWVATPLWILEKIVMIKRRDRVIKTHIFIYMLIRANDANERAIFSKFSPPPPLPL